MCLPTCKKVFLKTLISNNHHLMLYPPSLMLQEAPCAQGTGAGGGGWVRRASFSTLSAWCYARAPRRPLIFSSVSHLFSCRWSALRAWESFCLSTSFPHQRNFKQTRRVKLSGFKVKLFSFRPVNPRVVAAEAPPIRPQGRWGAS